MKITMIILVGYILNIFISRYLNIKMLKYGYRPYPEMWFIPCFLIIQLIMLFEESKFRLFKFKFKNKFTKWFFLEQF